MAKTLDETREPEARLASIHECLLRESAISAEVAAARGYRTVWERRGLARLGFKDYQQRVPALLIPLYDVFGEPAGYQARPDSPRLRASKPLKYENPAGQRGAIDCNPLVRDSMKDPSIPLWVTEGVRKADSAISHGLVCVSLQGVYGWRGTNSVGGKLALPDWEGVALNQRMIFLAFDSDAWTKTPVYQALSRLKAFLEARKARVLVTSFNHEVPG